MAATSSPLRPTVDPFPVGGGELGRLIRAFDWSRTSLGPIATWSPALRTAVNIVLQAPLPLVMLWGPDGVMIYNDAYSEFAGQRHPRLLGSKVLEGWAEVADFNARVLEVGLSGGTLSFKDQELTLYRNDRPEQVWMDLNYGPVLEADGRPAGVLAIVVETTERVRAERRQDFLFDLGDRLRELNDAGEIMAVAAERLGRHLDADRAHWASIDDGAGTFRIQQEWTNGSVPRLTGTHPLALFGDQIIEAMTAAGTVTVPDTPAGLLPGVRALLAAPLMRAGRWSAALCVHAAAPRTWRNDERDLVREVADRAWAAVQRVQAEARERTSDARFRALVNATSNVVYRMSPDWREMRELDGRGFIADTEAPSVAWMDAYLFPEDQPHVLTAVEQAVRNKDVFQLEHRARLIDGSEGWVFSRAIPVFDEAGEIEEWFGAASDITARKRGEAHLKLVVNELNHRVKNNLAMVQAIAAQTFRRLEDGGAAQADFTARLQALARANDLLTSERWVGASMKSVLEQALEPYGGENPNRCRIEGPDTPLSSKTALSLSLAAHELATNAIKYGAWSVPGGRVCVSWRLETANGGDRLELEWRESGGPPVSPPETRGFGSRLIERGLAAEMSGTARLEFRPDGLVCLVEAPLERLGD